MATLYEVTGKNRYCGPVAIATVLGVTTDDASRLLREVSGRTKICGVPTWMMSDALRKAGAKHSGYRGLDYRTTLNQWVKSNRELFRHTPVIVVTKTHYATLLGSSLLCSLTKRQRVPLKGAPQMKAKVRGWIQIQSVPVKPYVPEAPKRGPSQRHARSLARHHGVTIERDNHAEAWWVWPPSDRLTDDPYENDHLATDWDEVTRRVEGYVAHLSKIAG